jgi:hypothetical protein
MCGDFAGMDTLPGKSAPSTYYTIPHQRVPFLNGRWIDWCKPADPHTVSQVSPIVNLHAACHVHAGAASRAVNTMAIYKGLAQAGPRRSIVRLAASALMSRQAHHATEAAVVMGRGIGSLEPSPRQQTIAHLACLPYTCTISGVSSTTNTICYITSTICWTFACGRLTTSVWPCGQLLT